MSWGVPRRPKISTKLGNPNPREGSDGDIQIKGTALGAKLWGKWSGRWWDIPLSRDGVTKFGVTDSNYLSIDRDSVDIFTNKVKVASFGATTTVKNINLTGKIVITSTGTQNVCIGTGNNDIGTDNIAIGVDAGASLAAGALKNICIGTTAGEDITTGEENVCIGLGAGKDISVADYNICIGTNAGGTIAGTGLEAQMNTCVGAGAGGVLVSGKGNTYIGMLARASGVGVINEVVLAGSTGAVFATGKGSNTLLLGNSATAYVLPFANGVNELGSDALEWQDIWAISGSVNSSDERLKENIQDLSISGLEKINALMPRTFDWKKRTEIIDEVTKITHKGNDKIGFIAQEVQDIIPELIVEGRGSDDFLDEDGNILIPKGTKSLGLGMSNPTIMAYMVKAVQELSAKLDTMQTEINNLKAE